jgi:hypothetical protein
MQSLLKKLYFLISFLVFFFWQKVLIYFYETSGGLSQ